MMGSYIWCRGTTDDKLNWAFNLYDVDKSGTIQPQEMEEIMLVNIPLGLNIFERNRADSL